ncbi:hypothetical protein B0H17DRAFT_332784 [Mycena rosella]|uniref:WD40 repeat-like protein n=1 Tax=Mycena rosella TaxID=1033263 RepID=A0AAD7DT12_MYCRO|nr:hypothetical protein B0H17DRAFT_332784 [Mycena rosella]
MAQNYSLLVQSADQIVWDSGPLKRNPKVYAAIMLDPDDDPVSKTPVFKRSLQPKWNFSSNLSCPSTSTITLRLYHHTYIPRRADPLLGECKIGIEELLRHCSSGEVVQLDVTANGKVSGRLSVLLKTTQDAAKDAKDRMQGATAQNELVTAVGACIERLDAFAEMGDEITKIHPYVSAAWKILTSVYEVVKQQHEMDKEVVDLVNTMVVVYSFEEDIKFVAEKIKILEDTLLKIEQKTGECANFLEEYKQHSFSERAIRTAFLNNNRKRIDDLSQELVKLKESFTHALRTQSLSDTTEIRGHTHEIRKTVNKLDHSGALGQLSHVRYDASLRSGCLPGTRKEVLDELSDWLTLPSGSSNILWLSGVAGSGKSSIATTLSQRFRDLGCLGAFIFFNRNNLANSNPTAVLHTIAYNLAQSNVHIRDALCTVIEQKPGIVDAPIRSQFEALLRGPLLAAPRMEKPVVVILDALDECADKDWRTSLISLIADDFPTLPVGFRFLITSRRDANITGQFEAQHSITAQTLGMSTDIGFYIQSRFNTIRTVDKSIPKEWPGESAMNQLAEHSGGLFIWASMACNFIEGFDPEGRLETLIAADFKDENRLAGIYTIALESSGDWLKDHNFAKWAQGILGCLVLGRAPLSDEAMDSLLSFKPGTASKILARLGSVTYRASDGTARVLHASFSDYLLHSGDHLWNIDSQSYHRSLALGCFNVLQSQLHFNMCGLRDSHLLNSEVADLPTRLNEYLRPELRYASQYWVNHLDGAEPETNILPKLRELLEIHFLYWLEVLSLLGQVQSVNGMLNIARKHVVQAGDEDLKVMLHDAQRFMYGFAPVMAQSAPHIYISALPLSPKESLVQRNFGPRFPSVLRYNAPDGDWLSLQKTLTGHSNWVRSVAFSPDGRRIVSGSDDNTIRIWDSDTGAAVGAPLTGHSNCVQSVAFSPDGRRIVSGSGDNTIRIWDSDTGAAVGAPLTGHSNGVQSVAFSPDGRRIVSGSSDNTIRIWDSDTGAAVGAPLTGHSNWVQSVAFSPDGRRIVSGSDDNTIRIWDSDTGSAIGAPLTGHTNRVWSVAFSPDGRQIVSGSGDNTIRIWDSDTGAAVGAPLTGHTNGIWSVAFSPDGRQIVSGSEDETIRLWHSDTESIIKTSLMTTTSTMLEDGWLAHRLIWVPAWLRNHFCGPLNSLVITPRE